jgi:hypothetical protein
MSIEQKLEELAKLAQQLDEAKKEEDDTEDEDDNESDIEGDDLDGEKDCDSEDDDSEDDSEDEPKSKKKDAKEMKESTKVDLGALFEGQELSEDFKLKTVAVFEAAVDARVEAIADELTESLEQQSLLESTELMESLVEKVDGYLDYMAEQWMEKNALAVNRGIKTEILESFVTGMKDLFESHYIDVPDEKYDLVEEAQAQVAELQDKLDEAVSETISLRSTLKETARYIQIEEAADGLAETDAEKFRELAESLSFTSEEEYGKKLNALRENYFSGKEEATQLQEEFITDTPVEVIEESTTPAVDRTMAQYLAAISRTTL